MAGIDNSLNLGPGYISMDSVLGKYYQNISPAIVHIENGVFAKLDDEGIPYYFGDGNIVYIPVLVIQYALMNYDLFQDTREESYIQVFFKCVNWLEDNKEDFNGSIVWRSKANKQYNLPDGWISGMYQGQALSVYLRAYQQFDDNKYLKTVTGILKSFEIDVKDGGFRRNDEQNCLWFEEYPTSTPSFVLNGFIYSMFGILDYYRVTKSEEALKLWNSCVETLKKNLHKYDVWYWSVYDQLKKQLVTYYYQKNVHIPLMKIMFQLTDYELFNTFAVKWEKSLNNSFHRFITKIMYRVKPRITRKKI
ncbi:MAG: hypothetical protein C0592_13355 [Marinilabiliales bacterium]|nr:MAG: hypothetical protein C0592_13355 [Marinilabiliales bacterium]